MMKWIGSTNRWLARRPVRSAMALAVGAVVAYLCYRIGATLLAPTEGRSADRRSLLGRFMAWPGGMMMPLAAGAIVLGVLLIPDRRFDGRWRLILARVTWWTAIAFAVLQLLDDHLLGQPGTVNPAGVEIPSPFQDLLELPLLAILGLGLLGALVTLPGRVLERRKTAGSAGAARGVCDSKV